MKMYEFIVEDAITREQTSVFYDGSCSLWYVGESEGKEGNEIDEEATLSLYFNPNVIEEYREAIINDNEIYTELGISELVDEYRLYDLLNEKFGANINEKGTK